MRQFGAKVGIGDFEPDETNVCRLDIDDMLISFAEDPETAAVVTRAEICESPSHGAGMLYRLLMESMFMGQGTMGASFSIEPESGKIYLYRVDPTATLDPDSFSAILEKFVNMLEQWRKTLAGFMPVIAAVKEADDSARSSAAFRGDGFMQV